MLTFIDVKSGYIVRLTTLVLLTAAAGLCLAWGTLGHERINRLAVLQLPAQPGQFFYNHLDFMTQEATVPDLRKYTLADRAEYPRHYADLENYGSRDSLPADMKALKGKYSEEFLSRNGTLPWYLVELHEKLTKAFREKRKTEILFLAADMGHYVADAHMPLHTTVNHDGQLTDQKGIHAFWEAHLPELFADNYSYTYRPAEYVGNVREAVLNLLYESHSLVAELLSTEKHLRDTIPPVRRYEQGEHRNPRLNKFKQPVHSLYYARLWHQALNGMVERQMNKAVQRTADLWYTAWVNAGSPDLSGLDDVTTSNDNRKKRNRDIELFKKNKLTFPRAEREF